MSTPPHDPLDPLRGRAAPRRPIHTADTLACAPALTRDEAIELPLHDLPRLLEQLFARHPAMHAMRTVGRARGWSDDELMTRLVLVLAIERDQLIRDLFYFVENGLPPVVVRGGTPAPEPEHLPPFGAPEAAHLVDGCDGAKCGAWPCECAEDPA